MVVFRRELPLSWLRGRMAVSPPPQDYMERLPLSQTWVNHLGGDLDDQSHKRRAGRWRRVP